MHKALTLLVKMIYLCIIWKYLAMKPIKEKKNIIPYVKFKQTKKVSLN